MSLGSRTVERGGRAIFKAACPASTPREPLLFLYPRLHHPRLYGTLPTEKKLGSADAVDHATAVETKSSDCNLHEDERIGESGLPGTPRVRRTLGSSNENHRSGGSRESSTIYNAHKDISDNSSIFVRRVLAKLSSNVEKRKADEEYKETTRLLYRHRKRRALGVLQDPVDWRAVLSRLIENTPQPVDKPPKGSRFEVPSAAIDSLLYHPEHNIWRIGERTHCRIQVLNKLESTEKNKTLVVNGNPENISQAYEEIQSAVAKAAESSSTARELFDQLQLSISGTPVTLPSSTITYIKSPTPPISEPDKWNKITFDNYVNRLTKHGKVDFRNRLSKSSTRTSETYVEHVRSRLNALFEDPKLYEAISVDAFEKAVAYFIKTGQIKDARRLFVGMDMIGLTMRTQTFNIMLRGAAKIHDLHNYSFLLSMMLKRGHLPDAETWLAFLSTLTDFHVQVHVIAAMRKKGLLRRRWAVQILCRELASLETEWSIMKRQSHADFILHMDQRYGPHWLTPDCANRIFHQLALHGFFSRCCAFAVFMSSRLIAPNKLSLQTVISRCRILGNFEAAMLTLKVFRDLGVEPCSKTYHHLFYLALDKHWYSSARVIWRYACLNNATTFRMRIVVRDTSSLWIAPNSWTRPATENVYSHRRFWLQTVGKVILGNLSELGRHPAMNGEDTSENKLVKKLLLKSSRNSSQETHLWRSKRTEDTERVRWTHTQMNLDLMIHKQWLPASGFWDVLSKAYHQDMEWVKEKIWFKRSLVWMLHNAVGVELVQKEETASGSIKILKRIWSARRIWK